MSLTDLFCNERQMFCIIQQTKFPEVTDSKFSQEKWLYFNKLFANVLILKLHTFNYLI